MAHGLLSFLSLLRAFYETQPSAIGWSLAGKGLSEVVSTSLHVSEEWLGFVTWHLAPRGAERGIRSRRRQLGELAPEVDLRLGPV